MAKQFTQTILFLAIHILWLTGVMAFQVERQISNGENMPIGLGAGGPQSILSIAPGELNLGTLGPGEEAKGVFYLKNLGKGSLDWYTEGPDGWLRSEYQQLSGVVNESPEPVKFYLIFKNERTSEKILSGSLLLRLESGGQTAVFTKEIPIGNHRESIRFNSSRGNRTLLLQIRISGLASASLLDVEPIRLDLGSVRSGDEIARRVQVTNRGKEILKWKAGLAGTKGMPSKEITFRGRYVSFRNEAAAGTGSYLRAGQLLEGLELFGEWAEEGGYPAGQGEQSTLRYRFNGTGISLFFLKSQGGGPLGIYIDEQLVNLIDGFADRKEKAEIIITEDQPDGPHVLTVVNYGGRAVIDGVRIFGKPILKGPRGWITVFPDSGMTTRETDYVNVSLNTRNLAPGIYGEYLCFTSNGGEADIEVLVEVVAESQPKLLDVHRYITGSDYLYTTNPQVEKSRLQLKGYRHIGIAFRLFSAGTPGTTEFFRWFNPAKGDHFYSSDPTGGKPLQGYLFEGSIGNIATFRLSGTKELYRWYHPGTGRHFYTTDQGGEGLNKTGYRFDGIAGYVR